MKYIDETEMLYEIIISKGKGKLTPKAEQMLIKIANHLITKFQYSNYDDRNDCINEAILTMLLNWQDFDELKYTKPFSYFTEICKRGMAKQYTYLYDKKHPKIRLGSFEISPFT